VASSSVLSLHKASIVLFRVSKFIYLFIYLRIFMLCSYLQDAQGRFRSGFVMGTTGRKTEQFTWRDTDETKVTHCVQKLRIFFQKYTKCVESVYAGLNTVLYSRPLDAGYSASAIGTFEEQTWPFRERNGYLLLSFTSCQNRNMECRRSSRCVFPVSCIPTNSTVPPHKYCLTFVCVNTFTHKVHQKMFQRTRSSYGVL